MQGSKELARALREVGDVGLRAELRTTNKHAADYVVAKALPNVPVGATGKLRSSVRALASQTSGRAVAGNAGVPYAGAIHWGRIRGNVGRPPGNHPGNNLVRSRAFLWDAADRYQHEVAKIYEQEVTALVAHAVEKVTVHE